MTRRSIDGGWIYGNHFSSKCEECGMPTLGLQEFHPYEACVEFKRTHDSRTVEPLLERLWAASYQDSVQESRDA